MVGLGPEERALGGLLAVVAGEAWCASAVSGPGARRPAADRLLVLGRAYAEGADARVIRRHAGRVAAVETPAWVLAIVLARPSRRAVVGDTLELALALGMLSRPALGACVAYAELAWAASIGTALPAPPDDPAATDPQPDHPFLVAARVGRAALETDATLSGTLDALPEDTPPALAAAVLGLVGLRLGPAAIPEEWLHDLDDAMACFALAPALIARRGRIAPLPSRRRRVR
jgi:hypothetical protein